MSQYIPGSDSPENLEYAARAESEFDQVLQMDPRNVVAMASLASLSYNQATGKDIDRKIRKLDEAKAWYEKLLAIDPRNKEAYYTLGVIAWSKWYPAYSEARAKLGLRPEAPGPLPNLAVRDDLRSRYSPMLEEGISNLTKALEIDPMYDDAMAYMNLLIRERADLRDTVQEYQQDVATADQWVHKTLETKRAKASARSGSFSAVAPAPGGQAPPSRIRVGGNVQQALLVQKVEPVYPPLARQARIQGVVRFDLIIGGDGQVKNVTVLSGHPLLVPAAMEAVRQWVYKPTLLNGEPVEVTTTADVNFLLPPNQ
jgi:TonB family protein